MNNNHCLEYFELYITGLELMVKCNRYEHMHEYNDNAIFSLIMNV